MRRRGHVAEALSLVVKELDRHPLADRHEIQSTVAVEVHPRRVRDHAARIHELGRPLRRDIGEVAAVVSEHVASRWHWPPPRR